MVLSLAELALLAIANGIKDGAIQHPHFLPPKLRQHVLDTILKRSFINDPKCLALLSSVEFLNGMEAFSIEPGQYDLVGQYELEFLNRLEASMATVLPNGGTVGAGITKLNLSVYGYVTILDHGRRLSSPVTASSFRLVSRLINQCPNTTSLVLRGIMSERALEDPYRNHATSYNSLFPSVLNEIDACTTVMENLVDLSLCHLYKLLSSDRPIINFNRLTTLKLDDCSIQVNIWADFLRNVPTLENLQMIGVKFVGIYDDYHPHPDASGLDWILPFPMPQLKSLEIVNIGEYQIMFKCNKAFVDNLMGCPEIRRVCLSLGQQSTDEESMERLENMNIDLTVKVRYITDRIETIRAALDSGSKFKVVRIFHERIDSFELNVWREWSPELSTALENITDSCSKLTTFSLRIPDKSHISISTEIEPVELKRINAAMLQFFGAWERATQLKELNLVGNFSEAVILSIFESCLNLNRLEIMSCPAIRDQYLIDWVSNGGGKLTHLIFCSQNVNSEGIIPILAKIAEALLLYHVHLGQASGEGRNWKTVLNNLCPYAKRW